VSVADARAVIERAIGAGTAPAAAIEVGSSSRVMWTDAFGTMTFDPGSPRAAAGTIFDLASLTKPIATTTVLMALVRAGSVSLDEPVAAFFEDWRGVDREMVTVADLLEHASGLPARLVDRPPATRREFEHEIGTIALEYAPRTRSIYSDLGFILLGFLAADRGGAPLDVLFERIMARLRADTAATRANGPNDPGGFRLPADRDPGLVFTVLPALHDLVAPTEPMKTDPRRGRRLVGEVHDDYAAALSGVAGHAGLFGTAAAVGAFARVVLRAARPTETSGRIEPFAPATVRRFTTKTVVAGSSRALGWDTMLPTSSCGTRMSPAAFGHVGFTGTSLWIDPVRDRYFVLLTNRVCGGGTLDQIRDVRRSFHDALGDL
jgi:CubicO group peptidase (beta-lactamase class C family)